MLFITVYPLLFIFQGFDITDNGYMATGYHLFFSNPENVSIVFAYWLTCFFGAVWMAFFGGAGLFGLRIFGVIVTWLTIYFYYRLLTRYAGFGKTAALVSLSAVLVLTYTYARMFEYNRLTALLYAGALYFLCMGLKRNEIINLFVGSSLVGINFFSRISNICGVILLIAFAVYILLTRGALRPRMLGAVAAGMCAGTAAVFLLMGLLGHTGHFLRALGYYTEIGVNNEMSHDIGGLFRQIMTDNLFAFIYGGAITIAGCLLLLIVRIIEKKRRFAVMKPAFALCAIILTLGVVFFIENRYSVNGANTMLVRGINGVCYFFTALSAWNLYKKKLGADTFFLILTGVLALVVVPLGSDNGMYNSIFGMWLIVPPVIIEMAKKSRFWAFLVLLALVTYGFMFSYSYNFRESVPRTRLVYAMESGKLKWIYTNGERARLTDEIVSEVKKVVSDNEKVIIYGAAPMFYYLTDTLPALDNPWAEIYSYGQFSDVFNKNIISGGLRPKIALMNFNANNNDWPAYGPVRDMMRRDIEKFIDENDYYKSSESVMYDIYLPK
uniref:Glycosyltransferase RgtA/B/C/D-like domain-containing protein n=1 Tax=uncultured bacterium contig00025 TaxID=1181514 RepID=A0A806KK41_9BACT|nr:hypothetical protein [uncultured bacterium contig00025]